MVFNKRDLTEPISKIVDHVQGQGENRFEIGVYTIVFEHFEAVCNATIEQKIALYKAVLGFALDFWI